MLVPRKTNVGMILCGTVPTKDSNTNIFNTINSVSKDTGSVCHCPFRSRIFYLFTNWKLVSTSAQTIVT